MPPSLKSLFSSSYNSHFALTLIPSLTYALKVLARSAELEAAEARVAAAEAATARAKAAEETAEIQAEVASKRARDDLAAEVHRGARAQAEAAAATDKLGSLEAQLR